MKSSRPNNIPDLSEVSASVDVLGIAVNCINIAGILNRVQNWCREEKRRSILYVNAHCLNLASTDPEYRRLLNQADLVYSDGISVVWASRFLGGCRLEKMTGADWIEDFCRCAQAQGLRIYFLAGRPGVARRAAVALTERYPDLQVVGICDGYFQEKSESEALAEIAQTGAQVVLIGMGTPEQEKWLAAHRQIIHAPVCWVVGALFDYVAGLELRCPAWMNALGLEWLWRLFVNPRGKWKRYLFGNPLFVYRLLRQKYL